MGYRPTPTARYQAVHPRLAWTTPHPDTAILNHLVIRGLGCDATSSSSTRMSRRRKTSQGTGIPKEECHNEKRTQTMTILEKVSQGKATCLALHCNWPWPTPHGRGPGKPYQKLDN